MTTEHPEQLAGATQPTSTPEPTPDTAREVFPVRFEKDFMDFSTDVRNVDETTEEVGVPKSSLAPESVVMPESPTGLEDVSPDDLVSPAPRSAEKDKSQPSTTQTESGGATSSGATSTGRRKPSAAK